MSVKRVRNFYGHGECVTALAFSPDSKLVASASWDKVVRVWDVNTGLEYRTLSGHIKGVNCVAFSQDGKLLASGSEDGAVKLWDWQAGQDSITVQSGDLTYNYGVSAVAFSPNGRWLSAALLDGKLMLWELERGGKVGLKPATPFNFPETGWLLKYASMITSLAFTPDQRGLVSASCDHSLRFWDIETGLYMNMLHGHGGGVTAVTFSPDGKWLASASRDRTVKIWTSISDQLPRKLECHSNGINFGFMSKEHGGATTITSDRGVDAVPLFKTIAGHTDAVRSVAFSPNSILLASASLDRTVRLWNVKTGVELKKLKCHGAAASAVTFSQDGKWMTTASFDGTMVLWDVSNLVF